MKFRMMLAAAALALSATGAQAANFSFAGALDDPSQVLRFNFTVGAPSTVTLRSYSYAGGTNAQGVAVSRGGFDPILGLYDTVTGNLIGQNDDGGSNVPADTNGAQFDTFLQANLAAGAYTATVSVYPNFNSGNLYTGAFSGATSFNGRTNAFAFDVLNVDEAVGPGGSAVPEPATWAMLVGGFGLVGGAMRRRTVAVRFATAA